MGKGTSRLKRGALMLLKKRPAVKDSDARPPAGSSWAMRGAQSLLPALYGTGRSVYERNRRASMPYCLTL